MEAIVLKKLMEFETLADEGVVFLVKFDGVRKLAGDPKMYTVVLSGGLLDADDYFHVDGVNLVDLLDSAMDFYIANRRE